MRAGRGQGGIEYLMTYGWAILVIMALGVVIWSLGIFNRPSSLTTHGFKFIKPQLPGTSLTSDGVFTGVFVNGMGANLKVENVNIENDFDHRNCTVNTAGFPIPLSRGEHFRVDATDCVGGSHEKGEH